VAEERNKEAEQAIRGAIDELNGIWGDTLQFVRDLIKDLPAFKLLLVFLAGGIAADIFFNRLEKLVAEDAEERMIARQMLWQHRRKLAEHYGKLGWEKVIKLAKKIKGKYPDLLDWLAKRGWEDTVHANGLIEQGNARLAQTGLFSWLQCPPFAGPKRIPSSTACKLLPAPVGTMEVNDESN